MNAVLGDSSDARAFVNIKVGHQHAEKSIMLPGPVAEPIHIDLGNLGVSAFDNTNYVP